MAKVWHIRLNDTDRAKLQAIAQAVKLDRSSAVREMIRDYHTKLSAAGKIRD